MKRFSLRSTSVAAAILALSACSMGDTESELIASGKTKLAQKDVRAAIIQFKNALGKNQDSAEARLLLGRALLMSGDPLASLIELERARDTLPAEQVVPEMARAMLAAGQGAKLIAQFADQKLADPTASADLKSSISAALAEAGDVAGARAAAELALRTKPGFEAAVLMLARLDLAGGDMASALRQLDAALSTDKGSEAASLMKAEVQQGANNVEGALTTLRAMLALNTGSTRGQAALVDLLFRQGKRDDARVELDKLKKLGPALSETLTLQSVLAFEDKDYKSCIEFTDRVLASQPNNVRVLLIAGAANYRLQRLALAEGYFGRVLKSEPGHAGARQLLARTYLQSARPEKAIEALQPVLDSAEVDANTLALAGEAYLQAGDSKRSDAAFKRALAASPADVRVRTSLATAQLSRGDSGAALGQLESIAKSDPGVQADVALTSARIQQRDFKGALAALDRVDKKLPDQAFPVATRGLVQYLQGDKAGAAASLERALKLQPGYFPAVARLAGMDLQAGQPDKARQRFKDLIKADPKNTRARLALVDIESQAGAPDAVVAMQLRDAVKASPSDPVPHLVLIDRLMAAGQVQDALAAAQEATSALPDDLSIMQALGRTQVSAGDSRRGVGTFKRLTSLQPKNPTYHVQLAEAFTADSDRTSAAQELRKALELQPGNVLAQRGLALLAAMDKRYDEGVTLARALQKSQPQDSAGFALEGEIEALRKNWAAASTAFRAALQRDKRTPLAILLHRSLSDGGQPVEADRLAADWRREHADDAAFLYYLGERASAASNWAAAEVQFRSVLALQPRNAAVMNNIAWLMATQRKPGAVAMAEGALALAPDRASLLDTLALAQETENQSAKALETQKRAVALDLKSPALRVHLARLLIKEGRKSDAKVELEALAKLGAAYGGQADVQTLLKQTQ
jgi:putative PEP-CTERM system TPR-repeat lipoprotein